MTEQDILTVVVLEEIQDWNTIDPIFQVTQFLRQLILEISLSPSLSSILEIYHDAV